jgi:hypothetical protein
MAETSLPRQSTSSGSIKDDPNFAEDELPITEDESTLMQGISIFAKEGLTITQERLTEEVCNEARKKLIKIGHEYHLTNDDLNEINQYSLRKQEEIGEMINAIDNIISRGHAEPKELALLGKEKKRLEELYKMEHALIGAAAIELMKYGDPVEYIIKVYNSLHEGDTQLGKVLILSKACQSISNSDGLQPKLFGQSGKGKTHASKAMYHLLPDTGHKLEGSLSAKSLFYYPDLKPGTIIFSDDIMLGDGLADTLKRSMSNFQQETTHRIVDRNLEYRELVIPERIVWWLTSVNNDYGDEILNRLYGLEVDDSSDMDTRVMKSQLKKARKAEIALPETNEVSICRAIFAELEKHVFGVYVPFGS